MNIRIKYIVPVFILVGSLFSSLATVTAHAEAANLTANSGFETTTDGTAPDNWTQDNWGTNDATFAYVTMAHTGTHAAQTTITNYTDGDAKWMPVATAVSAGTTYTYSDWYEASATTNVWAQYQLSDGSYSYSFLKSVASATDWTTTSVALTTPANVTQVKIFHVLASVGSLTIDDTSLSAAEVTAPTTCSPSYVNGLANGDFEDTCQTTPGIPDGWNGTAYGTNSATYANTNSAYTGNNAIQMTNPTDDAEVGLTTTIQNAGSSERYNLQFQQSGSTYAYAYVAYGLSDGTTKYESLMSVPATLNVWSHYSDTFVTPTNTTSLTITIATSGAGSLTLDTVSLTPLASQSPAVFANGIVSITFDDGDASTYTNGFSVMKNNGFKGTYYLNAGSLDTTGFMTSTQVKALAADGQEIGSHLYHHSDMVQLDTATIQSEQTGNIAAIQGILGSTYNVTSFASPYGSYTSGDIDTIMQYAGSHRTTDGQLNTKANLNSRQIHARLIGPDTTTAQIKTFVTEAISSHSWLVLVYHNIASNTSGEAEGEAGYTVTPAKFKAQMTAIKSSGVSVLPVAMALSQLQAQE